MPAAAPCCAASPSTSRPTRRREGTPTPSSSAEHSSSRRCSSTGRRAVRSTCPRGRHGWTSIQASRTVAGAHTRRPSRLITSPHLCERARSFPWGPG
eukprot:540834-Prymnesium_polylepis.4